MIILLSPAKTLDTETPSRVKNATQPVFLENSAQLVETLKGYNRQKLGKLMSISDTLAETNVERYKLWQRPFDIHNARPAIQMFRGDVYVGLDADTLSRGDLTYAQKHLRILSGLYGVLKPLDLIQPYRLEMGTRLKTSEGQNLYDYWGENITQSLNAECKGRRKPLVVNLASVEYFSSVQTQLLDANLVAPVFQDEKNGKYKIISFFAKKARGAMARYLIQNRCKSLDDLRGLISMVIDSSLKSLQKGSRYSGAARRRLRSCRKQRRSSAATMRTPNKAKRVMHDLSTEAFFALG